MHFDIIIRNGEVYDGCGSEPISADIGIKGDRIKSMGNLRGATAERIIDCTGLAVAPGFINVLSHAWEALLHDGRSLSDIKQGVTLEVLGEGYSPAPLNDAMASEMKAEQGDIEYEVTWRSVGEFLQTLVASGISCNVATFVGATTVRVHELGYDNKTPSQENLRRMRDLVRTSMREGALGLSSALIYTPACFATTEELVELAGEAASAGGIYISHMRSEGDSLIESVEELLEIARRAKTAAEIYHLKAAGKSNWKKIDRVIESIAAAKEEGLQISADMYTYTAAKTGLDAAMPPWVQEGGQQAWIERLKNAAVRAKVKSEMLSPSRSWENGYMHAGPEGIVLVGFKSERLKPLMGRTLAQVAAERGRDPAETAMDLVVEDKSRVEVIYHWMCEENVRKQIRLPYMSFGSDAPSMAPEGAFLRSSAHPRAYGNFARLLAKYVREEKILSLSEAIRKLTSLPASNLSLVNRGRLAPDYYADVVVFDPKNVRDTATFELPHRLAEGVHHVLVNGVLVIASGEHTGATPGRAVYGRGARK
ncbi:MAG TPA: D-aminoacylase [Candidatus Obscuribacterales bacterium]